MEDAVVLELHLQSIRTFLKLGISADSKGKMRQKTLFDRRWLPRLESPPSSCVLQDTLNIDF